MRWLNTNAELVTSIKAIKQSEKRTQMALYKLRLVNTVLKAE